MFSYSGLLRAFNLTVTAVTDTTAAFSWQHNPENNVHDIQFKVCFNIILRRRLVRIPVIYISLTIMVSIARVFWSSKVYSGWKIDGRME